MHGCYGGKYMRLVLYTLDTDFRRANGIAATTTDIFNGPQNDPGAGTVIKMSFIPVPNSATLYALDEDTRMAIALTVGLLSTCDEVVVIMHASPSRLSVQGAQNGNATLAAGYWSLNDAREVFRACAPSRLFFLCCKFGRTLPVVHGQNNITDGAVYIQQRLPPGSRVFAMNENVMAMSGMPVLRPTFYTRQL